MLIPEGKSWIFTRLCSFIVKITEGKFAKFFIKPIVFTLVPWLLLKVSPGSTIEQGLRKIHGGAVDFLLANNLQVIVATLFIVWFLQWLIEWIRSHSFPKMWVYRDLISALDLLNFAVDQKEYFIDDVLKNGDSWTKLSIKKKFQKTSKPDQQLHFLTSAVKKFFEEYVHNRLSASISVSVDLIRVENGKACGWESSSPTVMNRKTNVKDLRQPNSTATIAIQNRACVIISSTRKELKLGESGRFYAKAINSASDGSLICYPITDNITDEVIYILSVYANSAKVFHEDNLHLYQWMLDKFAIRIRLEYKLLKVKEKFFS